MILDDFETKCREAKDLEELRALCEEYIPQFRAAIPVKVPHVPHGKWHEEYLRSLKPDPQPKQPRKPHPLDGLRFRL